MSSRKVESFFSGALECSIYLAPKEPGLTHDELQDVGKKAGFLKGEIEDAITKVGQQSFDGISRRLLPNQGFITLMGTLLVRKNPEYRNISAFDFVYSQLNYIIRAEGIRNAQIDRKVVVERAIAQNIPGLDVEAAITIMVMCKQLAEKNNQLRPAGLASNYEQLPSQQRAPTMNVQHSEERERAYSLVREIIERRSDGQPPKAKNGAAAMEQEEWISAVAAVALLGMKHLSGTRAICKRAHVGLIKARAERFVRDGRSADSADVPAEFWWAEGEAALHQNWTTGDFDTWIDHRIHLQAFGVKFRRSDIERSKPPPVVENALSPASTPTGEKVFIGHGRSLMWRELKDFLQDRLHLAIDEFNNVSTAGIATANRLEEMLDVAAFAFMIMTAEDEQPDGKFNARLNVIHEAGLFQGRLGFKKAIVLLEEGCEEFSNLYGLGQIRFPRGTISAKFEEIRAVLEREKLIT
ncbi:MAG: nucleotide-binding protein [Xanthobacteraceae bacterium]